MTRATPLPRRALALAALGILSLTATSCGGVDLPAAAPVTFTETAGAALAATPQASVRFAPNCLFNRDIQGGAGCEIERMSGGVAVGDYDGDGDDDLYVTRIDGPGSLYRNDDSRFTDVTAAARLASLTDRSNGAGWADLDNDGDADLVVTTIDSPRYYLFMNDGDGTFTEEAVERGTALEGAGNRAGFSVAFGDIDNDGWTDIHFTEWLNTYDRPEPNPGHARLLRNRGADAPGYFEDVTDAAGVALGTTVTDANGISEFTTPIYSFASSLADLDGDGWADLVVASDFGTTQLFWNDGDGTFTEGTSSSGIGFPGNAMGLTVADVDNDGDLDVFITAISGRANICQGRPCPIDQTGNRLFLNNGDRTFTRSEEQAGVADGAWGWGSAALDLNNDTRLDLVMTNGVRFDGDPEIAAALEPYAQTAKRVWMNTGDGRFSDITEASRLAVTLPGSGLAVLDVDGDGNQDLVMIHPTRTPTLWKNGGDAANTWLGVRVAGTSSNRDGYGAVVEVLPRAGGDRLVRHIGVNSHFLGQSTNVAHVGLGPASSLPDGKVAEVRVRFPATGREVVLTDVTPGAILEVTEPAS